jgi:carbonic anhydrase
VIDGDGRRPRRGTAVLSCMDVRIDVLASLGLRPGDAHVLRNAGGRVTDDVLRSLVLSSQLFEVDTVIVMQHTDCGLSGVTDDELRARTGVDMSFLPIDEDRASLHDDVEGLASSPSLPNVGCVVGVLLDVHTGAVTEVVRRERSSAHHEDATPAKHALATLDR